MSQTPNPQYPHGVPDSYGAPSHGTPVSAIAALVCGVIGICVFPLAVAGLILGIVAMNKTSDGRSGRGMALAGVILGGVGLLTSLVVVLFGLILLPAMGAARETARRMQNSTQLRGIHQGMVLYANSNKNKFPGLTSRGDIVPDGIDTGNSGDGNTPEARMWMLIDGNFMTVDYIISPSETAAITPYYSGPMLADNYSYALLEFEKSGPSNYMVSNSTAGRAAEWSQTLNSQAIVMSDRNIGSNATTAVESIHSSSPGAWRGSILWNDNHVGFENTQFFQTKYANGNYNNQDNLFVDETQGLDALLVHD